MCSLLYCVLYFTIDLQICLLFSFKEIIVVFIPVVAAIKALTPLLIGKLVNDIFTDFGSFWRKLTSESQLRWVRCYITGAVEYLFI